ncbi:MAG: DUF1841 family protein [Myxococcaceae bacterium]|nr:DUF1841 family protein [Myxococcaceae bacterium]MCI0672382.1 DUF1841 family protein [Myxococcaceae bacterium]
MHYDAMRDPDPRAWLALPEEERLEAIERAHHPLPRGHDPLPNPRLHAAIHAVVETQLAQDAPPEVRKTLGRLVREGLTRHEALHAIGSAAADAMARVVRDKKPFDAGAYAKDLAALRAADFRGAADND